MTHEEKIIKYASLLAEVEKAFEKKEAHRWTRPNTKAAKQAYKVWSELKAAYEGCIA